MCAVLDWMFLLLFLHGFIFEGFEVHVLFLAVVESLFVVFTGFCLNWMVLGRFCFV